MPAAGHIASHHTTIPVEVSISIKPIIKLQASQSIIMDENKPSNINIQISSPSPKASPSKRKIKHRNSSFLHRLRLRKKDDDQNQNHERQHHKQEPPSMIQKSSTMVKQLKDESASSSSSSSLPLQSLQSVSPSKTTSTKSTGGLKRFMRGSKLYKALENDVSVDSHGQSRSGSRSASSRQSKSDAGNSNSASAILVRGTDTNAKFNANALREIYNGALESEIMSKVEATTESSPNVSHTRTSPMEDQKKRKTFKKRKSDEGIHSINSSISHTDRTTRSLWTHEDGRDQGITREDGTEEGSIQKRFRESNSPNSLRCKIENRTASASPSDYSKISSASSSLSVSMPPMEMLELNTAPCYDLDSSLSSSSSPVPMDSDSLDAFYDGDISTDEQVDPPRRRDSDSSSDTFDDQDDDEEFEYLDNGQDDESCASTVVNSLPPARLQKPPPGASKEEQDRFYWDLCYGSGKENTPPKVPTGSWSSSRRPPTKSCISAKKTPWTEIANSATKRMQMRKLNQSKGTPTAVDRLTINGSFKGVNPSPMENKGMGLTSTPTYTGEFATPQSFENRSGKRSVQFGHSSAAEFESSRPTLELTPLPAELAREEFKVDGQNVQSDEESTELHQETARNADTLAMWEGDFDSFCEVWDTNDSNICMEDDNDNDNDEVLDPLVERKSPKERTSCRSDRRNSRAGRRSTGRDDRRSSTFFSKEGGSLLKPEEIEMRSPKEKSPDGLQQDSGQNHGSKEIQGYRASIASKDSLQFSSPSTMGDSYRLSSSGSEVSKETPTTDVASSSTLLRSVHSEGGASLERTAFNNRQADHNQDLLEPNQLDFANSPGGLESPLQRSETTQHDLLLKLRNPLSIAGTSELLQTLRTDFEKHHDVSSTFAMEEIDDLNESSLLDIAQELCEIIQPTLKEKPNASWSDVADVVKMSISLLEELNSIQDHADSENLQAIVEAMAISCKNDEVEEIYAHFADIASSKWTEQEGDALLTATNWLQPLFQSSCEEEATIRNHLEKIGACKTNSNRTDTNKHTKRRFKEEMRAIKNLDTALEKEQVRLEEMKLRLESLTSKCDFEHFKPVDMLRFRLLNNLLPYDCHLETPVNVTYFHLDNSRTVVTWDSSASPAIKDKRDSMCTADSFESTAAVVMTTPKAKRLKNRDPARLAQQYREGFLPEGSVARKLYSLFLDDENMKYFISEQFKSEHEMGILTLSDAFQRLNLMALDVLALQKYYTCRLDTPSKSRAVILHVTISLGQMCSIGLRFTFDLSAQRSFLMFIPSEVFVESITGEPAVPVNSLLHIAQRSIKTESSTNAFLLKRICTEIVDTIQGRNNTVDISM